MRLWETPVPIPNTTVKTQAADGTALETMWESRWTPDQKETTDAESAASRHWKVSPSETGWSQKDDKSDANPYQPGSAVISWFYQ